MTAIKTTNELNPLKFIALTVRKPSEWKLNEFDGKVKTDGEGRNLYRGDGLQAMRINADGSLAGAVFGQVSINVATPIDLFPGKFYEPVGVYVWNDYDARKTSITIETLVEVKP
jgi:hypothetical protein